jgi:BirA family biotin operon repressor/biotin-[acetyl-CoA-carboxylase] ligase
MPLNQDRINQALISGYWRVKVLNETGSTQNDLTSQIRAGVIQHGAVLATEYQSAGRGRLDRKFEAPAGSSLLFSLFLIPVAGESEWGWLPLLAGQSVVAALDSFLSEELREHLQLKWPNDILLNGMKLAGILSERIETKQGPGVVIGIGLNVHTSREEINFADATSLTIEGCELDRNRLLVAILENISVYFGRWEIGDLGLLSKYRSRSATIGAQVRIETPSGASIASEAIGIEPSGALILATGERVTVGDVVHLQIE